MITAVVLANRNPSALVRTLASLVPGVAQGLVADALVVTPLAEQELADVAETVGATCLVAAGDPWLAAARIARQDWLFCLEGGDVPAGDWIEAIGRFLSRPGDVRLASLARRPTSIQTRWADLSEAALGAARVRPGHLVHRAILADERVEGRPRPVRLDAALDRSGRGW